MALELTTNFATSTVATAPSPASSGTSLVVGAGHGARFPNPATVPFNAVICPADAQPTPANAEIVRVTAKSTDTFTITRAQEGSSARTVVVGDRIFAGPTAKTMSDIWTAVDGHSLDLALGVVRNSLVDAKGDVIAASANDTPVRVAVGSNNQALVAASGATPGVRWQGPMTNDLGQAGLSLPQYTSGFAATAPTASRAVYVRFWCDRDYTITAMAFVVNAAASASDAVDVGIYSWSGSSLTRMASAGATTSFASGTNMQSAGLKVVNLSGSASLSAGTAYYAAFSYGTLSGSPTLVQTNTVQPGVMELAGTGVGAVNGMFKASSHPLAAGPISTFTTTNTVPVLGLRE